MNNYHSDDFTTTYEAGGDIDADDVIVLPGGYVGVAKSSAASGDIIALQTRGKVELTVASGAVPVDGGPAYLDSSDELTHVAGGNRFVGTFVENVQGSGDWLVVLNQAPGETQPLVINYAFATGATYALPASHRDIYLTVDTQGGAVEVDLPTAASMSGRRITFVRAGTGVNAITIDQAGSETINGSGSAVASLDAQHDTLTIQSNGVGWIIIASIIA